MRVNKINENKNKAENSARWDSG